MNELDNITRHHLKKQDTILQATASGFIVGVLVGIVLASFLHKYVVHPLGW